MPTYDSLLRLGTLRAREPITGRGPSAAPAVAAKPKSVDARGSELSFRRYPGSEARYIGRNQTNPSSFPATPGNTCCTIF